MTYLIVDVAMQQKKVKKNSFKYLTGSRKKETRAIRFQDTIERESFKIFCDPNQKPNNNKNNLVDCRFFCTGKIQHHLIFTVRARTH